MQLFPNEIEFFESYLILIFGIENQLISIRVLIEKSILSIQQTEKGKTKISKMRVRSVYCTAYE